MKRLLPILMVALAAILIAVPVVDAAHQLFSECKAVLVCGPLLKDNGAATVTYADTKGFNRATFILAVGAIDITCDAKLQECDTYNGTYADITGAAITQLTAGSDNTIVAIEVDLTKLRKRYLQPVITSGDGTLGSNVCGMILLHQADSAPTTATLAGLAELVKV